MSNKAPVPKAPRKVDARGILDQIQKARKPDRYNWADEPAPLDHVMLNGTAVPMPRKLKRDILWRSTDGTYVVVEGPFPRDFSRSLAFKDLQRAVAVNPQSRDEGLLNRPGTQEPKRYAKTLSDLIEDAKADHNDWGEVAP